MTTTSDFIASNFGISMAQARDFIMSHLSDPRSIYDIATQFHVTSAMLGEVTGYTSADVEGFFTANGMDGMALHAPVTAPPSTGPHLLVLDGMDIPDAIVKMNDYQGVLSTASLHDAIVAIIGPGSYDAAFSAAPYDVNLDGLLSPSEMGSDRLGTLPATVATVESVFFGTLVNALKSIDATELDGISSFAQNNVAALQAGDPAVMAQLVSMMLADMSTPAAMPVLSDSAIADAIISPVADMITMVGSVASGSPFEVLLSF